MALPGAAFVASNASLAALHERLEELAPLLLGERESAESGEPDLLDGLTQLLHAIGLLRVR
jgi:hypothetical protein